MRPLSAKEQDWGATNVLTTTPCTVELSGRQFTYDTVWDTGTSQTDLYQEISDSYLQSFLDGYNATVRVPYIILKHHLTFYNGVEN